MNPASNGRVFPFLARVMTITPLPDEEHHYCFGNVWGMAEVLNTHTDNTNNIYKFYFSDSPSRLLSKHIPFLPGLLKTGDFFIWTISDTPKGIALRHRAPTKKIPATWTGTCTYSGLELRGENRNQVMRWEGYCRYTHPPGTPGRDRHS